MAAAVTPVGRLTNVSEGGFVPIFSVESVDLSRSQNWDIRSIGPQSTYIAHWAGSQPVYYDINFDILVGWGDVRNRSRLKELVGIYHAMAAHRVSASGLTLPPPMCRLLLAGYVNMTGVLMEVRTSAKGPWATDDSLLPTLCTFTGRFGFLPGYSNNGIVVPTTNNRDLSSRKVAGQLYYR